MKFSKKDRIPHTCVNGVYYMADSHGIAFYAIPATSDEEAQLFILSCNGIPAGKNISADAVIAEAQKATEKAKLAGYIKMPNNMNMAVFTAESGEILGYNKKYVTGFAIKPDEFRVYPFIYNEKRMHMLCGFKNAVFCGMVCPIKLSTALPEKSPGEILALAKQPEQKQPRKIINLTEGNLKKAIDFCVWRKPLKILRFADIPGRHRICNFRLLIIKQENPA